jgi:hypothetical protein
MSNFYETYPSPPPGREHEKNPNKNYTLPPPCEVYNNPPGEDFPPENAYNHGTFPTYPGGYKTTTSGLYVATAPWGQGTGIARTRQNRADGEAKVEAYWESNDTFGRHGTTPATAALIVYACQQLNDH